MLNAGSLLFTRTVLVITILAASSLLSCVNVGEKLVKEFVLLDDLLDGETTPLFALTFANQFSMNESRANVKGLIGGSGPFPQRIDWWFLLFNSSASLVEQRMMSTDVNRETGRILARNFHWDPITADVGWFFVIKAASVGANVRAGTRVRLELEIKPGALF